jgi:4-alpha-glucanotransferase
MSEDSLPVSLPPFPQEYRASGLLLHVTSLPSPYGIGDVGPTALKWIDRLHEAGQSWWQALPLAASLQDEGAKSFVNSWNELMNVIASKSSTLAKAS